MAPITRALEVAKPKRKTFSTPHPNVAFQGSLARTRGTAPSQGDEGHSSLPSQACQYRPSRGVSHLAFKPLLRTSENAVMAKFAQKPQSGENRLGGSSFSWLRGGPARAMDHLALISPIRFTRRRPRPAGTLCPSDRSSIALGCERAGLEHCRSLGSERWCQAPSPRRPSLPR